VTQLVPEPTGVRALVGRAGPEAVAILLTFVTVPIFVFMATAQPAPGRPSGVAPSPSSSIAARPSAQPSAAGISASLARSILSVNSRLVADRATLNAAIKKRDVAAMSAAVRSINGFVVRGNPMVAQLASTPPGASLSERLAAVYGAAQTAADRTLNNASSNLSGWVEGSADVAAALAPLASLSVELSRASGEPLPSAPPAGP
jgi:hypothetical protein